MRRRRIAAGRDARRPPGSGPSRHDLRHRGGPGRPARAGRARRLPVPRRSDATGDGPRLRWPDDRRPARRARRRAPPVGPARRPTAVSGALRLLFGGRARRRWIHLILGGALAMPYVLVGSVILGPLTGADDVFSSLPLQLGSFALGLPLAAVTSLFPPTRPLESAAARALCGVDADAPAQGPARTRAERGRSVRRAARRGVRVPAEAGGRGRAGTGGAAGRADRQPAVPVGRAGPRGGARAPGGPRRRPGWAGSPGGRARCCGTWPAA